MTFAEVDSLPGGEPKFYLQMAIGDDETTDAERTQMIMDNDFEATWR